MRGGLVSELLVCLVLLGAIAALLADQFGCAG